LAKVEFSFVVGVSDCIYRVFMLSLGSI
jgi:hypothetical protein